MEIDPRLVAAASESRNFGLLIQVEPLLAIYGAGAESTAYSDPNGAIIKCRQFGEVAAEQLVIRSSTRFDGSRQVDRIAALERNGILTAAVADAFHDIRKIGNDATHEHLFDVRAALTSLERCWQIGNLLRLALLNDQTPRSFIAPEPPTTARFGGEGNGRDVADLLNRSRTELTETLTKLDSTRTAAEAEARGRRAAEAELEHARRQQAVMAETVAALRAKVDGLVESGRLGSAAIQTPDKAQAADFTHRFRRRPPLNEVQSRRNIDRQLTESGWTVQDYAAIDPTAALGVAVREFPLASGFADYLLYVDSRIVGVIEAKREGTALIGVEHQTRKYAEGLRAEHRLAAWRRGEPLPFRYESTGTETRFTNQLDPKPRSREVFQFARPETVQTWMHQAEADPESPTLRARILALPELQPDGLRPNQFDAIKGIEKSLKQTRPRGLVQMATGAGKTFTAVTLSYRLLKHARASRVLFLVDRNNLGEQAEGEFENFVPRDDGRRFGEIYNVQRLSGRTVLGSTNVALSTIQRLYLLLQGRELPEVDDDVDGDLDEPDRPVDAVYNPAVPPETFDLIVVDECHRSIYGRWRSVLDYFDAPIIGLTATPTKQTLGFFDQNLISEYPYERSVIDGVNVPFDVYRIRTEITEQGATIEANTVVPIRDRKTRVQRYEELDDDYAYAGAAIGRDVIAEDQVRTLLSTFRDRLYSDIFPGRSAVPKTLIFAKTDAHADVIVEQVREVFGEGADFAAKITYTASDAKQKLQDFRNSPTLRVAVTVDMIATGTDVRAIECVFFMRSVRSAVYFEQMKGRGSRVIDADDYAALTPDAHPGSTKERFVIVDAVGVTDSPLVDATPMERVPSLSLEQLLAKAGRMTISPDESATLAVRLAALASQLDPDEDAEITEVAGGTSLRDLARRIADASDDDAVVKAKDEGGHAAVRSLIDDGVAPLTSNPALRQRILDIRRQKDLLFDQVNADTVLSTERISWADASRDRVASFREYLAEHRDEIAAMQVVHGSGTGRPTYRQLKTLAEQVARVPAIGSVDALWKAYAELGEIADPDHKAEVPDLIAILRHELSRESDGKAKIQPFASAVEARLAAWLSEQERRGVAFSEQQLRWIDGIVDVVKTSVVITVDDLDQVPLSSLGGADRFALDFSISTLEDAQALLDELNTELTA
ncbi:DEAD/DEAH box helicase family protein [Gordonia sp. Z-3]|uniref:DEAD/DEAH box helicase family protein n=1 Tax=Gordonia sp. Z-3 TaxID=3115408 RepID=UPI002E2DC73E|nr:DEAD/DEAH box helicase family protein [Gordonia sp. Z-3]MED5801130.1 DEAD/DEAH box helicase family protein [Gordonia sp. Z-3]